MFDEELSSRALSLKHSSIGSRETAQLLLNAGYGNILEEWVLPIKWVLAPI